MFQNDPFSYAINGSGLKYFSLFDISNIMMVIGKESGFLKHIICNTRLVLTAT